MTLEQKLSKYIQFRGIQISSMSRNTGISAGILYKSLNEDTRRLRADEFIEVCVYLDVDPKKFTPDRKSTR